MQRFSLTGTANHVLRISDQWEIRAQKAAIDFRTTRIPECQDYPQLALFPYPVQSLLVEQYKIARKEIVEGEEPQENVGDDLVCPMDCLFYRQYQLPCKHLWYYCITTLSFSSTDWARWAALFENSGFEIYEATTKTYVENQIFDTIGGPDRGSLMMREILDHVKTRYYEMSEYMAEWTQKEKDPHIARWLAWLDKLTGPIQKKGVAQALKELEEEAETEPNAGQNIDQKEHSHKRKRSSELKD